MNVSELCATPSKATNSKNQAMESYSLSNPYREPDQDISNNNTALTQSVPVNRYTLPPLSQRQDLQQRLPSLVDISTSFEESTEESAEEMQTESTKSNEGLEIKQLIEKCSTLCNDLARYKTWRKGLEKDREAIFDFVTHTAHDILDSLVAMQQQQDAVVSNEAEYEMIRQARNWKENRKPKYRRRSKRNMIGQQCHSCHTSETPEWRRGPDGARTLCNACGLHYSKLMRKESVTVASYKFLGNGPNSSGGNNNDGNKKIEHQLRPHHPHEDQQPQELQHRQNDEQHNHPSHYIQPSPSIPRQHQHQQQQQQQQQHHIHHPHPHPHRHHHHQTQPPSVSHHHLHHQPSQHHQLSQTHPSRQDQHQHHH